MSSHWNEAYATHPSNTLSWYEPEPTISLELLDALGLTPTDSLIDIGGGESFLVDRLLARGHRDLTILDLSATALRASLARFERDEVTAIESDVTTWHPTRTYDAWHDRATLHFIDDRHRSRYFANLTRSLSPRGAVVIGVFSPQGPTTCSGLEVARYDVDELMDLLGRGFDLVEHRRSTHRTPSNVEQSFEWVAARRNDRAS